MEAVWNTFLNRRAQFGLEAYIYPRKDSEIGHNPIHIFYPALPSLFILLLLYLELVVKEERKEDKRMVKEEEIEEIREAEEENE